MSDEECIHGLGPIAVCTICNGRDRREAHVQAETPRVFATRFFGHCPECNTPIHEGQMVAWLSADARRKG